ncbi:MAG: substrate-binding domain-containing protein [Muribaculaceae bacterium]|nr:substrate-binding domain-containing protein [Muribaculaceae bacterium]MDE6753784.1 substrate-binding domain-containing protein [Muribaculaceae bacterium]
MKKLFKIFTLIFPLFIILLLTGGCQKSAKKQYRIGVSQCSGDYWRVKTNEDFKRELLLHDDVDLEIRSADNDNSRQIADIRYFMDNGFDLIIISPNEADELAPVVAEAYKKGIPIVTFDRMVDGDAFTAHLEVDNYELGKSVPKYARSVIRKPIKAIEIQGPAHASPAKLRHEGFIAGMAELPDAEVLASVYGNWSDIEAARLADSLLNVYPETNMIFAHTDHMAIPAARIAREKGRSEIDVFGIDGFPQVGLAAVKDSLLTATFLYPTEGEKILKTSLDILKRKPYKRITRFPVLSAIDLSNADILLSQDSLLTSETAKITLLQDQLDVYWKRHSMQSWLLYAVIIILILISGVFALLLKAHNANRKHREILMQKNEQLNEEKEKQNLLYEQLQDATRSKLVFFTNVSHDLRTPLTLISGPIEHIAKEDYLPPSDRSLLDIARRNITILHRLINQILDFRKYENGKVDLKLSEVNLPALLSDWTAAFKDMARRRDIRLSINIDAGCMNPDLAVDVEKLERVFFNLMSNAFKHTPDNGKISVSYESDGETVSFAVADTGCGISEEDRKMIFERFYQVDKENPKGSGIGLALTKAFIELHGGSIEVESSVGKGSIFKVKLPVRHCDNKKESDLPVISHQEIEDELMAAEKEEKEFDNTKPLVLIIDDNRDIQVMTANILGDEYNYIFASNGRQGVKMAVKYVPDLILCDVMMPEMDGLECCKILKGEVSTSHIPVLMLTACSRDEQRVEGYETGADAYLSKPFNPSVLISRCRNLLLNRQRIKELFGNNRLDKGTSEKERPVKASPKLPNNAESDFYEKFVEIVRNNISDTNLNIDDIAARMGLSQSQFTRKIKALTNYTPVEIIRNLRLRHARKLIHSSDKSISEIAFGVGFSSLAYFSRCFREAFGTTPSEERAKTTSR